MTLRLALLGDSIAYGIGAARPEDALAPRLAGALSALGLDVQTQVEAVPGARSSGLKAQVDRVLPWQPDVVVVVIGANDLTRSVPVEKAVTALRAAVVRLRQAGAQVVLAPAPDLSVVPHVPAAARELVRATSLQLRRAQLEAVREEGGQAADADTAPAFAADPSLFSADRFHPSSAGYALIAQALTPHVVTAATQVGRDERAG